MARRRPQSSRRYPRTARLNVLLQEIIAEEIERIDDERLGFFTVTAVEVDPGLEQAKVFWSAIGVEDDVVLEVLEEHRRRLQAEVNRQTHLRRTPIISFHADEVSRHASRIEELLRDLPPVRDDVDPAQDLEAAQGQQDAGHDDGVPDDGPDA